MERHNSSFIVWFVTGAAIGAAVALLMAPESGPRIRSRLAQQTERGRKTILESGQDLLDRGRELYERGREIAEDAAEMFERGRQIAEKKIQDRV